MRGRSGGATGNKDRYLKPVLLGGDCHIKDGDGGLGNAGSQRRPSRACNQSYMTKTTHFEASELLAEQHR